MSVIPNASIYSLAQTAGAQSRAVAARQSQDVATDTRAAAFADQLSLTIQESDTDSQVSADAEGQGGYGQRGQSEEPETEEASDTAPNGQPPSAGGIDLTA